MTERCWPRRKCSRGGVTCCNDQYFFPDAAARAYQASGMRAMLGLAVLDFPTAYAVDADGYLQAGLAARDKWKHEPLLSFSLAPHAPYTVGDASWRKIVVYARQLDLPIQTHLLETRDERSRSKSDIRDRPAAAACIVSASPGRALSRFTAPISRPPTSSCSWRKPVTLCIARRPTSSSPAASHR